MSSPAIHRSSPPPRHALTYLGVVAAVALLLGGNVLALGRANGLRATWPPEADTFFLPPSDTLRVASLGHRELFADLLHGKANVYFGTQLLAKMPAKWLSRYINTAIDLDPQFHRLYMSGATMVLYAGQAVDPSMVLTSNEILERGRKAFPLDWELTFQLGFNYLHELPQSAKPGDPRIPEWRQKGLEHLQYTTQFSGVPYYIPNLVARLLTKNGQTEMAISQLERAYGMTSNEQARASIRGKLISLRGIDAATRLELQRQDFLRLIGKSYPFVPEAFALVVGPLSTSHSAPTPRSPQP